MHDAHARRATVGWAGMGVLARSCDSAVDEVACISSWRSGVGQSGVGEDPICRGENHSGYP